MPVNKDGLLTNAPDTISVFSGGFIRPLDPDPNQIHIIDIAHALANQCRFTGHTKYFYSVGDHSLHVAQLAPPELKLMALLHDASEAYLADIARPVKHAEGFKFYKEAEKRLEKAIAVKFALASPPWAAEVMAIDDAMLWREINELMPTSLSLQCPEPADWTPHLQPSNPETTEAAFLRNFIEYGGFN